MTERCVILVGTPKGAFVLDGDTDRRDWTLRGPLCEGWPIHDVSLEPGTGALLAGGGSPWYGPAVWRSDDLGETWTHSGEGLTYGDDGPKLATVWNVTATDDTIYAGVEPAGLFRSRDRGATWEHVEGLTNHPTRAGVGAGRRRPDPALDRPPPDGRRTACGSASRRSACSRRATAGRRGRPATRACGRASSPDIYPEFGQCVHKLVMAADGGEHLYQQNHCGVYRSADGGEQWEEITPGLPSEFGFPMTAHPRDPQTVWTIPLNGADQGRFDAGRAAGVWRTHDGGDTWIRSRRGPAAARRLPAACCARRWPTTAWIRSASTSAPAPGQLYGSADEGRTLVAGRRQPAADLVGRGRRRWLTAVRRDDAGRPGAAEPRAAPRSSTCRARWSRCSRAPQRRVEADGATVAEVIADLDRQVPGMREPRARRRPERSAPTSTCSWPASAPALQTPVPAGADVHIIPAVSGG